MTTRSLAGPCKTALAVDPRGLSFHLDCRLHRRAIQLSHTRLASESEQVRQALLRGRNRTSIFVADPLGEVCLWLSRRSWGVGSSSRSHRRCSGWGRSASASGAAIAGTSGVASDFAAAWINNVVSTQAESLFSLTANTTVTVSQSDGQRFDSALRAAALVLAELVADLVSGGPTDSFIRVIQAVDES